MACARTRADGNRTLKEFSEDGLRRRLGRGAGRGHQRRAFAHRRGDLPRQADHSRAGAAPVRAGDQRALPRGARATASRPSGSTRTSLRLFLRESPKFAGHVARATSRTATACCSTSSIACSPSSTAAPSETRSGPSVLSRESHTEFERAPQKNPKSGRIDCSASLSLPDLPDLFVPILRVFAASWHQGVIASSPGAGPANRSFSTGSGPTAGSSGTPRASLPPVSGGSGAPPPSTTSTGAALASAIACPADSAARCPSRSFSRYETMPSSLGISTTTSGWMPSAWIAWPLGV